MVPSTPQVVIVGGGFAGVAAARGFRRTKAIVSVIDKRNHHLFQPLLYQVATAAMHPGTIAVPIRSLFRKLVNVNVYMKEVDNVDVDAKTIMLDGKSYSYHYLVLASGFETNYFAFLLWALIHILFLIDFRRKMVVFIEWIWIYFTGGRGARLITGDDRMPKVIKLPHESRLRPDHGKLHDDRISGKCS